MALVSFSLEHPEFDTTHYLGRFRTFQKTCNPFLAFYTNAQINEMRKKIEDQRLREEEAFKATGQRAIQLSVEEVRAIRRA